MFGDCCGCPWCALDDRLESRCCPIWSVVQVNIALKMASGSDNFPKMESKSIPMVFPWPYRVMMSLDLAPLSWLESKCCAVWRVVHEKKRSKWILTLIFSSGIESHIFTALPQLINHTSIQVPFRSIQELWSQYLCNHNLCTSQSREGVQASSHRGVFFRLS